MLRFLVIKPRDGAGSWLTFRIDSKSDLKTAYSTWIAEKSPPEMICQPPISGHPASFVAWFDRGGRVRGLFPMASQHLSQDGRYRYLGGAILTSIKDQSSLTIQHPQAAQLQLAQTGSIPSFRCNSNAIESLLADCVRLAQKINGLYGYVGIDLIIPEEASLSPVWIEVNPRWTSSYTGYRVMTQTIIPQMFANDLLFPDWRSDRVEFAADGQIRSPEAQ